MREAGANEQLLRCCGACTTAVAASMERERARAWLGVCMRDKLQGLINGGQTAPQDDATVDENDWKEARWTRRDGQGRSEDGEGARWCRW